MMENVCVLNQVAGIGVRSHITKSIPVRTDNSPGNRTDNSPGNRRDNSPGNRTDNDSGN